jgi:hypothetical protein
MYKKGGDKLVSIYWFVILTLIAGGVIGMVSIFYNSPYDVREVESEILAMKVADCVYPGGTLDVRLITGGAWREEFRDNFMERCRLNFDVKKEFDFEQYYVKVEFYDYQNFNQHLFEISVGNENWVNDCDLKNVEKEKLVKCSEKKFFAKDNSKNVYFVKILSIVRNTEKNVR